jgi:D-glycero-D-manno-heptose 1,7-bisphosphate phosphatase
MTSAQTPEPSPAAFLDRDGTLIKERGFLGDPNGVELLPGAVEGVRLLNGWGFRVFGVSNQSGVARGYYGITDVEAVNERVISMFAQAGSRIDHIYYCPHFNRPETVPGSVDCDCRKPKAGMIEEARRAFPIDLSKSFVAGDRAADIGLAQTVGVPGCLVLTGYGRTEYEGLPKDIAPAYVAEDLLDAVRWWGERLGLPLRE